MANEKSRVLTMVFTDLADSTALKSERGDGAVGELISRHREHVTRLAEECSGRIIDWAGDGCFLTFETSTAGVLFALRLQHAHDDESDLPGVRIGIHLGEITEKPGPGEAPRVEGLAVDVAARVSGLAKPGQVLMSSAVYNSARQRMGVEAMGMPLLWQLHGTYALKGFDTPLEIAEAGLKGVAPLEAPKAGDKAQLVKRAKRQPTQFKQNKTIGVPVWAVGIVVLVFLGIIGYLLARPATSGTAGLADAPIRSLAVLPFENYSGDEGQAYFVDGMTDALTAELARVSGIKVIARTSAALYKNSDKRLKDIAAELGVDALVEGSVYRTEDQIRITAQLVRGPTEDHLWGKNYENAAENVLELQRTVALDIVNEIEVTLKPEEEQALRSARTVDPAAHEAYLLGWAASKTPIIESLEVALAHFKRARALDPTFAEAWEGEARAHWLLGGNKLTPPKAKFELAKIALEQALDLDDTLGYANSLAGALALFLDHDWDRAHRLLQRGLILGPNDPLAHYYMGMYNSSAGELQVLRSRAERILELSPGSQYERALAANSYANSGEFKEARRILESNLDDDPNHVLAMNYLDDVYVGLELYKEADAIGRKLGKFRHVSAVYKAYRLAAEGRSAEAREALSNLPEDLDTPYETRMSLGWTHALLGDLDDSFRWMQRSAEGRELDFISSLRNGSVKLANNEGMTQRLRAFYADPRYWELVERYNFPPLPPEHPLYEAEQDWRAREAAEAALAARPKPVRRYRVDIGPDYPLAPDSAFRDRILAISPDGSRLVYQSSGGALGPQLVLRERDQLDSQPLPGTEGARRPFFSPDGSRVGFFAGGVWKSVHLDGGRIEVLSTGGFGQGAAWEADDSVVISGSVRQGLMRYSTTGEFREEITTVDLSTRDAVHAMPQVLPDGRGLLYTVSNSPGIANTRVEAFSFETGESVVIATSATAPQYVSTGHILYARAGALMAVPFSLDEFRAVGPPVAIREAGLAEDDSIPGSYAVSDDGTLWYAGGSDDAGLSNFIWIDLEGNEESTALPAQRLFAVPSLSPDATRVAVDDGRDIYIADLALGTKSRLTFDEAVERNPIWGPDGQSVWYSVFANPYSLRHRLATGRGDAVEVFRADVEDGIATFVIRTWTPDGKQGVGFLLSRDTGADIGVLDLSDTPTLSALIVRPGTQTAPRLSHDGRWLAYTSSDAGRSEVFVQPYPSLDGMWQITQSGGSAPQWAPDDSRIYIIRGNSVIAIPVETDSGFSHGREEVLFSRPYLSAAYPLALAPDGTRFLTQEPADVETTTRALVVVENWFEELKRLAPHPEAN